MEYAFLTNNYKIIDPSGSTNEYSETDIAGGPESARGINFNSMYKNTSITISYNLTPRMIGDFSQDWSSWDEELS